MNQTFQSIRVGIFFVLGLVLIYAVYTVIGSGKLKTDEGYRVIAEFDNIRTLTAGSDVRMAGVRIGQVAATELANGRGRVTLDLVKSVEVPVDSVASINMASLLGQNYVTVAYGAADEYLNPGDSILTDEGADIGEILSEVQKLGVRLNEIAEGFSGFGGDGMGDLFTSLNELVGENRQRFDTVMVNLEELTGKLNNGEGTLGRLINDGGMYDELMSVVGDFRSASEDFGNALGGANELVDRVRAGEGTLGRLLVGETLADDLEATVANIRSFSEKLNSGEGTLGKLVADDSLYIELRGMLNKADQALDSLGDSGPITAVGALSGALF
jgi:phospholipid/cholesterol/gamma-HCH transport system substrate-binding protein